MECPNRSERKGIEARGAPWVLLEKTKQWSNGLQRVSREGGLDFWISILFIPPVDVMGLQRLVFSWSIMMLSPSCWPLKLQVVS